MTGFSLIAGRDVESVKDRQARNLEDKIVDAAYQCFDRYGVAKTTIEDIAARASVSRPTIYKYFANKSDIIDCISIRESVKINRELHKRHAHHPLFADGLTDALITIVKLAANNVYVRRITENAAYTLEVTTTKSPVHAVYREMWSGMFRRALESGEMADDIGLDEAVSWLSVAQSMLLTRVDAGAMSEEEFARLVRRFVVEPLLARGPRRR